MFMATDLLRAISGSRAIMRTSVQDLESLLWTLLYAVYKNAVDEGGASTTDTVGSGILRKDFSDLFDGLSAAKLVESRELFLRGTEEKRQQQRGRLFGYASKRSSKGKNFRAVIIAIYVALKRTWQVPDSVENLEEEKVILAVFQKTVVKEDPFSIDYGAVESMLKQFWQ